MHAIDVNDLTFTYRRRRAQPARHALRGVSFAVDEGHSVALLGPNGSGKSTLLRVITGMLDATSGTTRVFGRPPATARSLLAVVFQNPGLDRHMTVWENLRDSLTLYGHGDKNAAQAVERSLHDSNLQDRRDSLVKTLSGGLARRVDLCRALLSEPRLLILDEPTTGLDPNARTEFLDQVKTLRRDDGVTLLMSTHLIDEAERADRVIMLHEGLIVADDAPASLRSRLGVRRETVLDGRWTPHASEAAHWSRSPGGWTRPLSTDDEARRVCDVLAGTDATFTVAPPTLADAFAALTGTSLVSPPRASEAA